MWTWALMCQSSRVDSYLNRILVWRIDLDVQDCSTFQHFEYSDHRLACAWVVLGKMPRMAGHCMFNLPLQDRQDYR